MNKEILVFGHGWIGKRISDGLDLNFTEARIATYEDVQKEIDIHKPKVIINAIGHFGKNVDDCEIDRTKTLFSHTFVPLLLAEAAIRNNIKLVHISSGCIYNFFPGVTKPISERKTPDFYELYYSRCKIYTECALSFLAEKAAILQVRLRIPLDCIPHPRNILTKLLGFKEIYNVPNSVTYIPDFIFMLGHLIESNSTGIYNTVNKGSLLYSDLLDEYKKLVPGFKYKLADYPKDLVRTNLILDTDKITNSGLEPRDINDCLKECVEKYVKNEGGK